ncbi:MAG: Smr/MutS family protein [Alphaproteobacteria bacterium]|nr:Smr/MutS family protein [Alphaproteobacteria bacterium]
MPRPPRKTGNASNTGSRPDDDIALWQRVTGSVKPLNRRSGIGPAVPAETTPEKTADSRRKKPAPPTPPAPRATPNQPAPLSAGAAPGLDKRTVQRLRRGQIRIEGRIDLHGMTREEAHQNLTRFLKASIRAGRRCVLVITGKGLRGETGSGVLRSEFPRWLNEAALRPMILSFAVAQPKDGGGGAFYVYLRKERGA